MKNLLGILFCSCAILLGACSTIISDESYSMASRGETTLTYGDFTCGQGILHNAVVLALQQRGWTVVDSGNPVQARLNELRQNAKISVDVRNDKLIIDTKGSMVDGNKAYVPVRYINYFMISVRENVLKSGK